MSVRVSLRGMLRLVRVDTLRRVQTVGFIAGRLISLLHGSQSTVRYLSALPVNMVLIDAIGRRYTGVVNFLGCSVFFLLIQLHVSQGLLTFFIFMVRGLSTGIFNFVYIYTSEVSSISLRVIVRLR